MNPASPVQAVKDKQAELVDYIRSKAATFDKKVLEDKIMAALNNPKLGEGNVMLGALANKVANSQRMPKETQEVLAGAKKLQAELDALTKAAVATAPPAPPAASGKGRAEPPGSTSGCALHDPPLGFKNKAQYDQMMAELKEALDADGIKYQTVGVRGSSVTGKSVTKGTQFGRQSDIDVFFILAPGEADRLGVRESEEIPGFIHPDKIMRDAKALAAWSDKWHGTLGRKVTPGAFSSKTKFGLACQGPPKQPHIVHKG